MSIGDGAGYSDGAGDLFAHQVFPLQESHPTLADRTAITNFQFRHNATVAKSMGAMLQQNSSFYQNNSRAYIAERCHDKIDLRY